MYQAIEQQREAQQWQQLWQSHQTLAHWYRNQYRYDSAQSHLQAAVQGAERADQQPERIALLNELGRLHFWQDDYASAIKVLLQAKELAGQTAAHKAQAQNLAYLTEVYIALGNYQQAMSHQLKGLGLSTRLADSSGMALAYHQLGSIYWYREQYEPARTHLVKALTFYPPGTHAMHRYTILASLASIFTQQDQLQEASRYTQQSLELAQRIEYPYGIAFSTGMLGTIALKEQRHEIAEKQVRAAIAQMKALQIKAEVIDYQVVLAEVLVERNRAEEAIPLVREALASADTLGSKRYYSEVYKSMATAYEAMGRTDSAYHYFKQHSRYRDSLFDQKKLEQMANLETEYRVQEQQRRIAALEAQQQQQERRFWLYGGVVLVFGLGFWLWWLYRHYLAQRRQVGQLRDREHRLVEETKQLAQQQHTLQEITRDLHLPLRVLRDEQVLATESATPFVREAIREMEQGVAMLAVVAAGEEAGPGEAVHLGELMPEVIAELPAALQQHATRIHLSHLGKVQGQRAQLALLFHHLIRNALQARSEDEPIIRVEARPDQPKAGRCLITIRDNGRGMPPAQVVALGRYFSHDQEHEVGVGLALARQVVDNHGGRIGVESEQQVGTSIYFDLPKDPTG